MKDNIKDEYCSVCKGKKNKAKMNKLLSLLKMSNVETKSQKKKALRNFESNIKVYTIKQKRNMPKLLETNNKMSDLYKQISELTVETNQHHSQSPTALRNTTTFNSVNYNDYNFKGNNTKRKGTLRKSASTSLKTVFNSYNNSNNNHMSNTTSNWYCNSNSNIHHNIISNYKPFKSYKEIDNIVTTKTPYSSFRMSKWLQREKANQKHHNFFEEKHKGLMNLLTSSSPRTTTPNAYNHNNNSNSLSRKKYNNKSLTINNTYENYNSDYYVRELHSFTNKLGKTNSSSSLLVSPPCFVVVNKKQQKNTKMKNLQLLNLFDFVK